MALADVGTEVWMGCANGHIERSCYDGSALPPLISEDQVHGGHIAQIKFICPRARPLGVLSGSSDGALVYWQTQPMHMSVFGAAPESNRFICNHKVWEAACDIPSTGLMWLGCDTQIVGLDPIKQTPATTIPISSAVNTLCRVGSVGCHPESLWAACSDILCVFFVQGGGKDPTGNASIGPVGSAINALAWSGDIEVREQ